LEGIKIVNGKGFVHRKPLNSEGKIFETSHFVLLLFLIGSECLESLEPMLTTLYTHIRTGTVRYVFLSS
jgi:hypothetical protein